VGEENKLYFRSWVPGEGGEKNKQQTTEAEEEKEKERVFGGGGNPFRKVGFLTCKNRGSYLSLNRGGGEKDHRGRGKREEESRACLLETSVKQYC